MAGAEHRGAVAQSSRAHPRSAPPPAARASRASQTTLAGGPNALWTMDFKGHFRTRDGRYCYPLTVADDFGRSLLGCQALLQPTRARVRPVLSQLFQEYGLPERIRTDNGAPFASCALARLSQLSGWLLRCGVHPELIEPGHPEQNPA